THPVHFSSTQAPAPTYTRFPYTTLFRSFPQRLLQLLPALLGAEVRRIDQFDALLPGERLRAVADHHHVARPVHYRARERDRVPDPVHAGHRAGLARGAAHDPGVEFVAAVVGEHRALAGVEQRIVHLHGT